MQAVTQSEFARIIGTSNSYVTQLKNNGRLVMTDDGLVDVEKSKKLIADTSSPGYAKNGKNAKRKGDITETIGQSYQQARAIREKYAALQAKVEYERAIGKLIEKDEVKTALDDIVSFVRQWIENLPNQVAAQLVGKDFDQIIAVLRNEVVALMTEMHKEAKKHLNELTKEE